MKKVLLICITLIFCTACTKEQKNQEDKTQVKGFLVKLGDLVLEDSVLLDAFYGSSVVNPITVTRSYQSILTLPMEGLILGKDVDSVIAQAKADTLTVKITDKLFYGPDSSYCVCITTGEVENFDCHPCVAILGMFILKKNNKGSWDCIRYDHAVRLQGSSGYISTSPEIYQIADQTWAVDVSDIYVGMGSTIQADYHFVVLDSSLTQIHIEDEVSFYEDDLGMCDSTKNTIDCFEYSTRIKFVKAADSGLYYDLLMETRGTILNDKTNKAGPYNKDRVYRWKDNRYIKILDADIK